MTDFTDFKTQILEWINRDDFSDVLVTSFVRMAEQKFNAELRVSRMIKNATLTATDRCATLPDDWLEFELVQAANTSVPGGWLPITYKARHEFYMLPDKWACRHYTIEGRQVFFGGAPDAVEGIKFQIFYFAEVPIFSDQSTELDLHKISVSLSLGGAPVRVHACDRRGGPGRRRENADRRRHPEAE